MTILRIPLKPVSINAAFQGRRFKTKECVKFCEDFMLVMPRKEMVEGVVEVEYHFYMVNHKMVDYDNVIKVTQDMLVKKKYIEDDRKIYKATIYKIPSDSDFIVVSIKPLDLEYIIKKFQTKL